MRFVKLNPDRSNIDGCRWMGIIRHFFLPVSIPTLTAFALVSIAATETLIRNYKGERIAGSLAEMEQSVQSVLRQVGCCGVKKWLEGQEVKYPAEKVGCECGNQARYVRQRTAASITLQGKIKYRRAY